MLSIVDEKPEKIKASKSKKIWTGILLALLVGCLICAFIVAVEEPLLIIISVISIVALQSMWFEVLPNSKWNRFANTMLAFGMAVPFMIGLIQLRKAYIRYELDHYGLSTEAKVVHTYTKRRLKGGDKRYAVLQFNVGGKMTLSQLENNREKLGLHEELSIRYSSRNPQILEVLKRIPAKYFSNDYLPVSQGKEGKGLKAETFMESPPKFRGGADGLYAYLRSNVQYPDEARKRGITGKVYLSFMIGRDGSVQDIKVNKGIGYGCDEAAVAALAGCPKWQPAVHSGKVVKVKYHIPINFSL